MWSFVTAPFTSHNVLMHRYYGMYENFIYFHCQIIAHCKDTSHLIHPSSVDGHLGSFHFLAITDNAAVHICVYIFVWTSVLTSMG